MKRVWTVPLILLLVAGLFVSLFYYYNDLEGIPPEGFFFGVSFGSKTANEAKLLIDEVKDYTNLFLINSWDISTNETELNEICGYAAENDLSFIIFFDYISLTEGHEYSWQDEWVAQAKDRWGKKFLGIYIYEEPGGKQIDKGIFDEFLHGDRGRMFENASTYSDVANIFVTELPMGFSFHYLQFSNVSKFVSDYALYWFDYLSGYDNVFVELGWNHSATKHIGLCRGAATAQGKDWGAIITWTYMRPPYLASGPEILKDMLVAYEAGAKQVIVFNFPQYPENNPYGILKEEHFTAMRKFWKYIGNYPENYGRTKGEVAFILPKDYGWGMRHPADLIWGLWQADSLSPVIWENMNKLIEKYGLSLDIVYDDSRYDYKKYDKVYF
ncbi:MAG: hypothetical protein ACYSR0_09820, partial [Planctomycetota bacterium]